MKLHVRSILFALVVPVAACGGGDDKAPSSDRAPAVSAIKPAPHAPQVASKVPAAVPAPVLDTAAAREAMPTTFEGLVAAGKSLAAAGKHGDAKAMFEAAITLDKKKAEPHIELARLYIETKQKGPAVAAATRAVKLAPHSSQAWNTMGRAELSAHKYDEAIAAFTKAVELNADNVFAWNNLGYTELLLKRYDDAAEHLIEATSRKGATGYMFNNLGTALEQLDRLDDARLAYDAGGKLGSREAASSRKRLEGVDTIARVQPRVRDEVRAQSPDSITEYEVGRDDVDDEGDEDESIDVVVDDPQEPVPSDNATM
jgi:tetratricopeptide (TPR) repeat protein